MGLAQVLIQKDYGTQEINETLEYIGSRLEAGTAFRMEGDVKKEEAVKITINGKAFIRNVEGIFVEQRVQDEEVARPLEKSAKSAGMTALVSFIW